MKATVSIRLPDELTKHLDDIAQETERPRGLPPVIVPLRIRVFQ